MTNKRFELCSKAVAGIGLKTISDHDLERLRMWKNSHRASFFFKGLISPADQARWYQGYLERPYDYMFVVTVDGHSIGCMGFRLINEQVDIYNVILGVPEMGHRGLMGKALKIICSYAQKEYSGCQGAKVLCGNPAVHWYQRNGFKIVRDNEEYCYMELNQDSFEACAISVLPIRD